MIIPFSEETPSNCYHLLTQTIIPRPIAWVLSENKDQSVNLAPFSFFNAVCSEPPLLMLSIGKKPNNTSKDTRINLLSGREFVIHIASSAQAEPVNTSAATLEYGDSEIDADQLAVTDFPGCPLPRLKNCKVAYHCKLYDSHTIGPNQQAVIYAEIIQLYVADNAITHSNNRYTIDAKITDPLARLGGTAYAELGQHIHLARPS